MVERMVSNLPTLSIIMGAVYGGFTLIIIFIKLAVMWTER